MAIQFRTTLCLVVGLALAACSNAESADESAKEAPAVSSGGDLDGARKEAFYWDVEGIFALTDGGFVFIDQIPEGITTLVDTPASDLLLLGAFMENEAGDVVGIGSELEEFDNPLPSNGKHDATWTLKIAGRGTLIGHQIEITKQETRDFLGQVRADVETSGEPWSGEYIARGTIGPAENGMGIIMGGSGEFEGATGYMTEENIYRSYDGTDYDVRTRLTFYLTN